MLMSGCIWHFPDVVNAQQIRLMVECLKCTADFWQSLPVTIPFFFSLLSKTLNAYNSSTVLPVRLYQAFQFCRSWLHSPQKRPNFDFLHRGCEIAAKRTQCALEQILGVCRMTTRWQLHSSHLYGRFQTFGGTGLAHVPVFSSIGKLITRSDFHQAVS